MMAIRGCESEVVMDKDVLDRQLDELCRQAVLQAKKSVAQAPDGRWIAASEWPVREIFQALTRDCYQLMIQAKVDAHAVSSQAAFSPGAGGGAAQPRRTKQAGVDRGRGD
jgi:hypothetical protein